MRNKITIIFVVSAILLTVGVNLLPGQPQHANPEPYELVYGSGVWKCLKSVLRAAGAATAAIVSTSSGNPWVISSAWAAYGLSLADVSQNCIFVK